MVAGAPCEFIAAESSTYERWLRFESCKKRKEKKRKKTNFTARPMIDILDAVQTPFDPTFLFFSPPPRETRRPFDLPLVLSVRVDRNAICRSRPLQFRHILVCMNFTIRIFHYNFRRNFPRLA